MNVNHLSEQRIHHHHRNWDLHLPSNQGLVIKSEVSDGDGAVAASLLFPYSNCDDLMGFNEHFNLDPEILGEHFEFELFLAFQYWSSPLCCTKRLFSVLVIVILKIHTRRSCFVFLPLRELGWDARYARAPSPLFPHHWHKQGMTAVHLQWACVSLSLRALNLSTRNRLYDSSGVDVFIWEPLRY